MPLSPLLTLSCSPLMHVIMKCGNGLSLVDQSGRMTLNISQSSGRKFLIIDTGEPIPRPAWSLTGAVYPPCACGCIDAEVIGRPRQTGRLEFRLWPFSMCDLFFFRSGSFPEQDMVGQLVPFGGLHSEQLSDGVLRLFDEVVGLVGREP